MLLYNYEHYISLIERKKKEITNNKNNKIRNLTPVKKTAVKVLRCFTV